MPLQFFRETSRRRATRSIFLSGSVTMTRELCQALLYVHSSSIKVSVFLNHRRPPPCATPFIKQEMAQVGAAPRWRRKGENRRKEERLVENRQDFVTEGREPVTAGIGRLCCREPWSWPRMIDITIFFHLDKHSTCDYSLH